MLPFAAVPGVIAQDLLYLIQSALVLDVLRSYQYLHESPEYKIDEVMLCGHSMGGASAIIVGAYLKVTFQAPHCASTLVDALGNCLTVKYACRP